MSRVYMIRHGKPASTWGDHVADPDPGLDVQGREQAKRAADALMTLPVGERPTSVFTSPLRRCRETATPFARMVGVEATVEPAVSEIPTPKTLSETQRGDWLRNAFTGAWGEIEGDIDYSQWRDRVTEAVARHEGAAIFSHFVAINAAISGAVGDDAVRHFQPNHCSITVFDVEDGVLKLVKLGESATTQVL